MMQSTNAIGYYNHANGTFATILIGLYMAPVLHEHAITKRNLHYVGGWTRVYT